MLFSDNHEKIQLPSLIISFLYTLNFKFNSSDSDDDYSYSSDDESIDEAADANLSEYMKKAKADAVVVSTTVMHLKAPWKTLGKSGRFYPQLIKEMLGISGKNGVKQKWKADAIRILFHSSDPNDHYSERNLSSPSKKMEWKFMRNTL